MRGKRPQTTERQTPGHDGGADAHRAGLWRSATAAYPAPGWRRSGGRAAPHRWRPAAHVLARRLAAFGRHRAELVGDLIRLQLTPQSRIFVATEPGDCRKGIAGRGAVCRQRLGDNPLEGAGYVFRNRAGTALKLWLYAGQGYWLMLKRLSQGRLPWWPTSADARVSLSARELILLLWTGNPEQAPMARDWRRVAEGEARRLA